MSRAPRRKRRFLQFSLRTFLVLLTAGCILLGVQSQRVRKQRQVVALAERLEGSVAYDYQYHEDPFSATAPRSPPGPALLRKLVGDDFFAEVVMIQLAQAQDRELRRLADQLTIRHLVVSGMFSDEGLESISQLVNLETLEIRGGKFTGAGLEQLLRLPKLRSLTIQQATLTRDAISGIGHLTTLEALALPDDQIGAKQLRHLTGLHKLSALDLSVNPVGDNDLIALQELTSLSHLDLERTMVTAKGIKQLREALPQAQIDY